MSTRALSFIGRLDRREESVIMNQQQEHAFIKRLVGGKDMQLVHRLYGARRVRDVYVPPTRGVDGSSKVMPKN